MFVLRVEVVENPDHPWDERAGPHTSTVIVLGPSDGVLGDGSGLHPVILAVHLLVPGLSLRLEHPAQVPWLSPLLDAPEKIETVVVPESVCRHPVQHPVQVQHVHVQGPHLEDGPGRLVEDHDELVPDVLGQGVGVILNTKAHFAVDQPVSQIFDTFLRTLVLQAVQDE